MEPIYVTVDTQKNNFGNEIRVTQNDTAIKFVIKIQQNGKDVPFTPGSIFTLTNLRVDNVAVVTPNLGEVTGPNSVTFTLGTRELEVLGIVRASVQILNQNGRISSLSFNYIVVNDLSEFPPSGSDKTLIEKVLGEGPTVIEDAKKSSQRAEDAAISIDQSIVAAAEVVQAGTALFGEVEMLKGSTEKVKQETELVKSETLTVKQTAEKTIEDTLAAKIATEQVKRETEVVKQATENLRTGMQGELTTVKTQLADKASQLDLANSTYPLYIETYEGSNQAMHPKVLYFESGFSGFKYWMAYTPYPGGTDRYENPCIAVSNDMINWTIPTGLVNPLDDIPTELLGQQYHFSDTHLVYNPDTQKLECWYRWNKNGVEEKIFRRTTTDGLNWETRELMFDFGTGSSEYCLSPAIVYDNGIYKMWYVYSNFIRFRESQDGYTWSAYRNISISYKDKDKDYIPWHLDVIKTNKGYEMALNAYPKGNINGRVLLYSSSSDGINFEEAFLIIKASNNPFAWDNAFIYRSSILKINNIYYIHYSAMDKFNKWHTGLSFGEINKLVGHNNIFGLSSIDMEFKTRFYRAQLYNSQLMDAELKTDLNAGTKYIKNLNGIFGRETAPLVLRAMGTNEIRVGFGSGSGGDVIFYRNTTQIAKLSKEGSFEILDKSQGIITSSGDGTRYRIQTNNLGGLTITNLTTNGSKNVSLANVMSSQSQSSATTVDELKMDFNSLIARLKSSGLMSN